MLLRRTMLVVGLGLLLWPGIVFGAADIQFIPEVPLPGFAGGPVTGQTIAEYIRAVFVYFIWIVGILAMFMIVYGGVKWVAAAGNPGRINDARQTINNAIIGLIIALTSVLLLNTINPRLTSFQGITIAPIEQKLFIAQIKAAAGDLAVCTKTKVAGEPSQACSGPTPAAPPNDAVTSGCDDLNRLINSAKVDSSYLYGGIDPFALKAIINIESPKTKGAPFPPGQPFSGPEAITGLGLAYGIGQFLTPTLQEVLPKVNGGGAPPGCRVNEISAPGDDRVVSSSCRAWLDKRDKPLIGISGLYAQVRMIQYYLEYQLNDKNCIKGDYLLAAAAYNQGRGGASDTFCSTAILKDEAKRKEVAANAITYIAKFKAAYAAACNAGT